MDVDFRVMRTFLELYKSLLGFVMYKLYTDVGLLYPPPLDVKKDEGGGGVDAYRIQPIEAAVTTSAPSEPAAPAPKQITLTDGKDVSVKDVQAVIESLEETESLMPDTTEPRAIANAAPLDETLPSAEEFVMQPSSHDLDKAQTTIVTLAQLASQHSNAASKLFAPYTFFVSRESPRHILEFVIRCFGGRVGWPETVGSGSPFDETDSSITHVIVDRPVVEGRVLADYQRRRKYVQPQWVVDSINAGKILLEELYLQGKVLPPHLSPFNAEGEGAYDPLAPIANMHEILADEEAASGEDDDEEMEADEEGDGNKGRAIEASSSKKSKRSRHKKPKLSSDAVEDADAIRRAELEAERSGMEPALFDEAVEAAGRASKVDEPEVAETVDGASEENMAKMLLSNKKRKLYNHIKKIQGKRSQEVSCLVRLTYRRLLIKFYPSERSPGAEEDCAPQTEAQGGQEGRESLTRLDHSQSHFVISSRVTGYLTVRLSQQTDGCIANHLFQTLSGSYLRLISWSIG